MQDFKNILIVSRSFYPMNSPRSFRTTELVKEFARQGHKVTLLTIKNDEFHIPFEEEYGVVIKDLGPLRLPRIELSNSSGLVSLFKRAVRRGLLQLFEYPDIELVYRVQKALKKESGYDLLISIAVPHPIHWGVAKARNKSHRIAEVWAADCGDPYMGAALDTFDKLFYFKYIEKYFCRKADYITIPLEEAKEGYYPEFHHKIRVIPQGFEFDEIDQSCGPAHPIPTFAYAGGLIPGGRDPRSFLEYLTSLNQEYKFILYTKNRDLIKPYMTSENGRIEIRDYIPRKKLLKVLSGMDFLINFENNTSLQQPSKLIDYYITNRPVLSVGSSDINKKIIDEFLNGNYSHKHQYQDMAKYRIENVCNRFLELSKNSEIQ
ncbi:Glycosyltransferase Family 4 [Fodinibius roseus]|uniref:Glycosyltransferase Family 4 n=1 Tax=Fodinibius roseus TaxID=1194090 RepID=A0A1M4SPH1_9BACT|nr:glycosyltransferase [Fodinibius roseus]SHE34091.1 Glycosyltransferase Family 4 [Fodinibius roseus]